MRSWADEALGRVGDRASRPCSRPRPGGRRRRRPARPGRRHGRRASAADRAPAACRMHSQVDQHDVGLHAGRKPAEVLAHHGLGAGDGGRMEQSGGRHVVDVAGRDAGERAGLAHLLQHVVRRRIGADPHIDAGAHIVAEVLHHRAVAHERRRAMRNRAAVVGDAAGGRSWSTSAPRNGCRGRWHGRGSWSARGGRCRPPIAIGVLPWRRIISRTLGHALGDVHREGELALLGRGPAVAQQVGRSRCRSASARRRRTAAEGA